MNDKEPVLLTVLIETARLRWFVAGISLDGKPQPLLRTDDGNIDDYLSLPFDEQVSFLRHRFSGSLQRGNDRLWGRHMKALQFVFVADGNFVDATPELTERLANHMVEWMVKPPVVFCIAEQGLNPNCEPDLKTVAGELPAEHAAALLAGLPKLFAAMSDVEPWELVPKPRCEG